MMRVFDEFQETLAAVAFRLACGCAYVDGTPPVLLTTPAKSTTSARLLFENHSRTKFRAVKWSKVSYINETVRYVLHPADPFALACNQHAVIISEMQAIRNRIAHKNATSRTGFNKVVRRRYGAKVNAITPGVLLLSPRFSPPLLQEYVRTCRVVVRDCVKA